MTGLMTGELLVLGGTSWLGGVVARMAADRGHRVTCLARGESGRPPESVAWVRADRTRPDAYDEVAGRRWDAVLDVSWQPDLVRSALDRLADSAEHWVYVSSCSVYADDATPGTAEDAPLHAALDPSGARSRPDRPREESRDPAARRTRAKRSERNQHSAGPVDVASYGRAKVACERLCVDAMGTEHVLLARPGLIVGGGDRSDRFGYWPARYARARDGEPVLVPPLSAPVQVVDVEDLAQWLVDCCERRPAGPMNAVGDVTSLREVLATCREAGGRVPRPVEVTDRWLSEHHVEPWMGPESLPLWLPLPEYAGFMTRSNHRAREAGLTLRPLAATVRDTLTWERSRGLGRERRAGLSPARETQLLAEV